MDGSVGFHLYMSQAWLGATYDLTPTWCMLSFDSEYSWITWDGWLNMFVPWQDELDLLDDSLNDMNKIGWFQDIVSVCGIMGCFTGLHKCVLRCPRVLVIIWYDKVRS